MKKVFISQPMKDMPESEITEAREEAIKFIKKFVEEDVEIIDSYVSPPPENDNKGLWCLGRSLQLMSTADIAYFGKGWERARGCNIEFTCALKYGIKIIAHNKLKEEA